jgi:Arc/MetJ-type ribon-helix-helix transcriptional regulator
MTAEPLPPLSPDEERTEEDLRMAPELLSALHDLGKASPERQAAVARRLAAGPPDPGRRLRLVGRARKVSVSMPEDLTAAVQQRVGRGEFSQYVTEAVARQLELDLLGELSTLLQAEHGPVSEEALAEARRSWPDVQ